MVPTVSYQGPASPVEVRRAPQLAHPSCIHTCGLAEARLIMGKWQPRGFQTRGRQETQRLWRMVGVLTANTALSQWCWVSGSVRMIQ